MSDVKICADCEHCIPEKFYASLYKCRKTESVHVNHITGERNIVYSSCQTERFSGECGLFGKNFTPKKKISFYKNIISFYNTAPYSISVISIIILICIIYNILWSLQ